MGGCSNHAKYVPAVNINKMTEREANTFSKDLYKLCTNEKINQEVEKSCIKYSVMVSLKSSDSMGIVLEFDKSTPQEDATAFDSAVQTLSKSNAIAGSKYSRYTFYLVAYGDIRLQTPPLKTSGNVIEPYEELLCYAGNNGVDTKYQNVIVGQ